MGTSSVDASIVSSPHFAKTLMMGVTATMMMLSSLRISSKPSSRRTKINSAVGSCASADVLLVRRRLGVTEAALLVRIGLGVAEEANKDRCATV